VTQRCEYSVHDLSRVQVDAKAPATPRFNMPFELGLAVAWQRVRPHEHTWCGSERIWFKEGHMGRARSLRGAVDGARVAIILAHPGGRVAGAFVFEARSRRIEKSLSDLGGTDVYIHHGRPLDLFSELTNAFVRARRQPSVDQMKRAHRGLRLGLPALLRKAGTRSVFKARVLDGLRILAGKLSDRYVS
jgi:hypothetical protein